MNTADKEFKEKYKKIVSTPGMFTFSSDKDYAKIVEYAASLVSPGGYLITICNTHSLSRVEYVIEIIVDSFVFSFIVLRDLAMMDLPP